MIGLFVSTFFFASRVENREVTHLYPGIGDPWEGHRTLKEFPNSAEKPEILSAEGNFRTEPLTGSERGTT